MFLPESYTVALLAMILSMICWGSWANTYKLVGKWRFELFYFDYSFGVLLAGIVVSLALGTLDFDPVLLIDMMLGVGRRFMLYAFLAGAVFNLANMLLVAAISVAGLSVAFPVGIGLALIIGVVWNYAINPQGNPTLLFVGVAIVVAAIVLDAIAYRALAGAKALAAIKAGKTRSTVPKVGWKGIVLSLISGVLMGSFYPIAETAREPLGPYGLSLMFTLGIFCSTFAFNLFFMNLPVQGPPVEIPEYFRGTVRQHLLGLAGGAIWTLGTISNFVAASAPREVQVGPAISYALGQGATLISALWGLLVWREFQGADGRVKLLLALMLMTFTVGLALISIAPLYAH